MNETLHPLRVLDGGLGTELEARGCNVGDSLWSARVLLESPATIERVHLDYLDAGADCITTASYQISQMSFAKAGLTAEDAARALRDSVAVARRACQHFQARAAGGESPRVAASVGPYGASLADGSEFHGNYGIAREGLLQFHAPRLAILMDAKPDLLACETIPSLLEAEVLLRILRESASVPAWFSFACRDEKHTVHGEPIADCARLLDGEAAVAAIGVNCTAPQFVSGLIQELRANTSKPIVVYPNAGRTWNAVTRGWEGDRETASLAAMAKQWRALGANWFGGCCGYGPADIRALRAALG